MFSITYQKSIFTGLTRNFITLESAMKLKTTQIVLLLLLTAMVASSCSVFQKSNKTKYCGCPKH
jgi:hypothetical protein